jgi:F-box/leucine-rich repeat protein 2/20
VNNSLVRCVLQHCPSLQSLRLDDCRLVTDAAFESDQSPFYPLRGCMSLRLLSLAGCSQLTERVLPHLLKNCRSLADLNFSRCKVRPPLSSSPLSSSPHRGA